MCLILYKTTFLCQNMEKLRFEFKLLPGTDGKTNIIAITSITTGNDKVYVVPETLQSAAFHVGLTKTSAFNKVKKSLTKRYQKRNVWITLSDELRDTYLDEDENIQFEGQFLEELDRYEVCSAEQKESSSVERLLEKLLANTQENKLQNLKNVAERFVIEKFTSKNVNATQWIEIFEKECTRFNVTTDGEKIEMLRLFMDNSCADWYSSMIIKVTMNAEWSTWREKFCQTFTSKGWIPVTNALLLKYKEGSLLDYAIKKEKSLLEMRRSMDMGTMIDLIAAGLPEFILNKINREEIEDTVSLFNELSKYEHLINYSKKNNFPKKKYVVFKTNSKSGECTPCKTCEKLNKGLRYHPEATCWFKPKEDDKKRIPIRHVNNTLIEAELNETDKKN